jgi:torulene dioxygenase
MASAKVQSAPKAPYNNYWVGLEDMKYVPPYLKDVPETTNEMACVTKGAWPTWLQGSFMR